VACKYNTEIAHPEDYVKIYMPQAIGNPVTYNFVMSDTDQTIIYGANYGGTGYPESNINIEFQVDNSLVDSFNLKNEVSYSPMPPKSYQLEMTQAVIPKGKVSTEPLEIKIKTIGALKSSVKYLLPLRISKAGKDSISISLEVTYFLITANYEVVNVFMPDGGDEPDVKALKIGSAGTINYTAEYSGSEPGNDITVSFKTDTALTDSFNLKNGTNYPTLPAASYEIPQTSVIIKAGSSASGSVPIKIKTADLEPIQKYLLPIRIDTVTGDLSVSKQLTIDKNKRVTYFIVQAVTSPVNPDSTYADYNRTNWKVIDFSAQAAPYPAINTIDGNPATFWITPYAGGDFHPYPNWITIDMGSVSDIHGFYIDPRKGFGQKLGTPEDIHIDISSDTTKGWVSLGEFDNLKFPSADGRLNIYLNFVRSARYFKITINKSISDYIATHFAEVGTF
jgi:hypothetical protein